MSSASGGVEDKNGLKSWNGIRWHCKKCNAFHILACGGFVNYKKFKLKKLRSLLNINKQKLEVAVDGQLYWELKKKICNLFFSLLGRLILGLTSYVHTQVCLIGLKKLILGTNFQPVWFKKSLTSFLLESCSFFYRKYR